SATPNGAHRDAAAKTAVNAAAASLAERSARFTAHALLTEARTFSAGRANESDLQAAMVRFESDGTLIAGATRVRAPGGDRVLVDGFTTPKGEAIEKAMLEYAGRIAHVSKADLKIGEAKTGGNTRQVIDQLIAATEAQVGQPLTKEHREAVGGMLTSSNGLYLLQGRAGSGKTTGVLEVVARHAADHGWRVRAM